MDILDFFPGEIFYTPGRAYRCVSVRKDEVTAVRLNRKKGKIEGLIRFDLYDLPRCAKEPQKKDSGSDDLCWGAFHEGGGLVAMKSSRPGNQDDVERWIERYEASGYECAPMDRAVARRTLGLPPNSP